MNAHCCAHRRSRAPTGNALDILGLLPGGGEPITIGNGSTLELATADSGPVSFAGTTGTLQLDQPASFTGQVSGFAGADGIDLSTVGFSAGTTLGYAPNAGNTGGTLTVTAGANSISIALLGNYMASSFALSSDGHGGTLISDPPPASQAQLTQPHA